jgi:hypothetical protein
MDCLGSHFIHQETFPLGNQFHPSSIQITILRCTFISFGLLKFHMIHNKRLDNKRKHKILPIKNNTDPPHCVGQNKLTEHLMVTHLHFMNPQLLPMEPEKKLDPATGCASFYPSHQILLACVDFEKSVL